MKSATNDTIELLVKRYAALETCEVSIRAAVAAVIACFRSNGTFFVAGNGGSAADADHICGELLKGFLRKRPLAPEAVDRFAAAAGEEGRAVAGKLQNGLRAISLLSHPGLCSAFANDVDPELIYAQQLWAQGRAGDVFLGISTGGGARNIRASLIAARAMKVKTILLTGNRHGCCEDFADIVIAAPESETFKIQELHLPIYHAVCAEVESEFFYV